MSTCTPIPTPEKSDVQLLFMQKNGNIKICELFLISSLISTFWGFSTFRGWSSIWFLLFVLLMAPPAVTVSAVTCKYPHKCAIAFFSLRKVWQKRYCVARDGHFTLAHSPVRQWSIQYNNFARNFRFDESRATRIALREMRFASHRKRDATGNLLLSGTVRWIGLSL